MKIGICSICFKSLYSFLIANDKYKINLRVTDCYADTIFVLFIEEAKKLIPSAATQLLAKQDWDTEIILSQVQNLCYKTYVFKINVTGFNLKERLPFYTVMKLFKPMNL